MSGFEPPSPLRKGQALFNFLAWLAQQEKVEKTFICYTGKSSTKADDEHFHLGDPFFITDERWDELWAEWVNSLELEHATPESGRTMAQGKPDAKGKTRSRRAR